MFLVDTAEGRIIPDEEIKKTLASQHPYRKWVEGNSVEMSDLPRREHVSHSGQSVQRRQRAFGYTEEDLKLLLTPMANTGKEPLGSMGNDAPMPALSSRSRMLFDYFTQKFAQVTNPPLDWEREEIVTSLESAIGPEPNLLADSELHAKKILIPLPVVNSDEMAQLKRLDKARIRSRATTARTWSRASTRSPAAARPSKSDLTRSSPKSTRPSPTARLHRALRP